MYKSQVLQQLEGTAKERLRIEDPPGSGQWRTEEPLSFTPISLNGADEESTRQLYSAAHLKSLNLPDPEWIVNGLIPTGLTFIVGQPKRGKSWLCLQMAQAVASSTTFLGRQVRNGPVIIVGLEDGMRRTQSRTQVQGWIGTEPVHFLFEGFQLGEEGMVEGLAETVKESGARLVVIDSLSSARGTDRRISENDAELAQILYPLSRQGQALDCSFSVIHHMPKLTHEDPGIDVRGTSALFGACDAVIGLYRKRGENLAKLLATGRDYEEEVDLAIEFTVTGTWLVAGYADQVDATRAEKEILKTVAELEECSVTTIAQALSKSRPAIARYLPGLVKRDLLVERKILQVKGPPRLFYSEAKKGGINI